MYATGNGMCSGIGFTVVEIIMDRVYICSTPGKDTTVVMYEQIAKQIAARGRA